MLIEKGGNTVYKLRLPTEHFAFKLRDFVFSHTPCGIREGPDNLILTTQLRSYGQERVSDISEVTKPEAIPRQDWRPAPLPNSSSRGGCMRSRSLAPRARTGFPPGTACGWFLLA